jgi:uncharacterized protein (UPF0332 family)/predicted nucleotidyltransferase
MKRGSLSQLSPHERQALDAFVAALKREADRQILLAALFGSKARGDADEDSDVDILIVADADPQQLKMQIDSFISELELEHNLIFNEFVLNREHWADYARRHAAFWQNVQRDGVLLLSNPALPGELGLLPDFNGENLMADHRPEIQKNMQLAREALDDAQATSAQGRYHTAANRAYYAVFYAANAMLATMGLQRSKHSAVKAAFHEKFIKTRQIETAYGDDYKVTMRKRDIADYDVDASVDQAFARDCVERAQRFVERMERHLKEKGQL